MIAVAFLYYDRVHAPEPNVHVLKYIPAIEAVLPVLLKGLLQTQDLFFIHKLNASIKV